MLDILTSLEQGSAAVPSYKGRLYAAEPHKIFPHNLFVGGAVAQGRTALLALYNSLAFHQDLSYKYMEALKIQTRNN